MKKRDCMLIGMHVLLVAGISTGYLCMFKQIKKSKQKCLEI